MTRYFLMYLLVVSIAVLGGCNDSKQLAAKDVLDVFQKNKLNLSEAEDHPENIFQQGINGIRPLYYQLSDGVIYLYVFRSEADREKGHKDFYDRPVDLVRHETFEKDNLLIFYVYGKNADEGFAHTIKNAIRELD